MVNKTISSRVRTYIEANPTASNKEVATALNVLVGHVACVKWRDTKFGVPQKEYKFYNKTGAYRTISISTGIKSFQEHIDAHRAQLDMRSKDMVNHPPHYKVGGIETIDFIKAKLTSEEFKGYLLGNVLKYASRAGHKDNAVQDAGKLAWYANKLAEEA